MLASLNVGTSYIAEYVQNQRLILSPTFSGAFYCGPSCESLISIGMKVTCARACEVTFLWSEALVTVKMAEPQHMETTLTRSIGERVSEMSSRSYRLRVSI